jgi:hypothetical protein
MFPERQKRINTPPCLGKQRITNNASAKAAKRFCRAIVLETGYFRQQWNCYAIGVINNAVKVLSYGFPSINFYSKKIYFL